MNQNVKCAALLCSKYRYRGKISKRTSKRKIWICLNPFPDWVLSSLVLSYRDLNNKKCMKKDGMNCVPLSYWFYWIRYNEIFSNSKCLDLLWCLNKIFHRILSGWWNLKMIDIHWCCVQISEKKITKIESDRYKCDMLLLRAKC